MSDSKPLSLLEAFDELCDRFVDPAEPYFDDGERWLSVASETGSTAGLPFRDEGQLRDIRNQCRALAATNEFALNGHENRISYVVGTGHAYRAVPGPGTNTPDALVADVQDAIDRFVRINRWHERQREIVRRRDRDGEAFLRFFPAEDGIPRLRFVEPGQIATPPDLASDASCSFGIRAEPHDVESVLAYCVDGEWIDGGQIQHRKSNVDANVKRGLPLFYPVRKNLRRAEKLLRNMSVLTEIQSAVAIIRKHAATSRGAVEQFAQQQADGTRTSSSTGRTSHFRRYAPGTILDASAGTDYEFPAAAVNASGYVDVLRAELRAIAARLVMPEFMLSSDASNANYSSTMVAEGPAVRMFQRLQQEMIIDDLEVMARVVSSAISAGRLPHDALEAVRIEAVGPTLAVRDRLREAKADEILLQAGAMTVQTMALRHGLPAVE